MTHPLTEGQWEEHPLPLPGLERDARATDPDTSHGAAKRARTFRSKAMWRTLACAVTLGYFTDEQLQFVMSDRKPGSVCKARLGLEEAGCVERTDERKLTNTNTPAIVFKVTDKGRALWREWIDRENTGG